MLQGGTKVMAICHQVSKTLDTMYCAELPREYHVNDLIEKELVYYPSSSVSFSKLDQHGRSLLISPDPVKETEAYEDHV